MSMEQSVNLNEQTHRALNELQDIIREHYPEATFEVAQGDDPEGTYLRATVDIEDTDEVLDVVLDSLFEIQVERGLPIHVIPLQPVERVLEQMQAEAAHIRFRRKAF